MRRSIQSVLLDALEFENPQDRFAFVTRACSGDDALLREVEELLRAHDAAGGFLPEQARQGLNLEELRQLGDPVDAPNQRNIGLREQEPEDRIERFEILDKIGEGGCGVVYHAMQLEPVRREVALKVIRLGMDTDQVVQRFERERQTLAKMDHPSIAKVWDAGRTQGGRPFFVMEWVQGEKITTYCDRQRLSLRQRLLLIVDVCNAVQHAHQKGIIHRDLKPSNILVKIVDGKPVPKLIDFGIAKAVNAEDERSEFQKIPIQSIGTPAYMSPEQVGDEPGDIDTRSDLYSLGILLYELLVGAPPFSPSELLAEGLEGMRRVFDRSAVPRPSDRFSTLPLDDQWQVAERRATSVGKLARALHGDLDAVLCKCLRKEVSQRYSTAQELASELQRYLDGYPVQVLPTSPIGRLWYWGRRRPYLAFSSAALLVLAGVVGIGGPFATLRIHQEQRRAQWLADQNQDRLVHQFVANATRVLNEGDLFGGLLWSTEALRLSAGDPKKELPHRTRITSILQQCPRLLHLFAHGTRINHAVLDSAGERVATASDDHAARVWDLASGKQLLEVRHDSEVLDVKISPNGKFLLTSGRDRTARVWDLATGHPICVVHHQGIVWRSNFSPDGKWFVTASQDHTSRVWEVETGKPIGEALLHPVPVDRAVFSPNQDQIVTLTQDDVQFVWETKTHELRLQTVNQQWWSDPAFSKSGRLLITAEGPDVHIWSAPSFQELPFSPLRGGEGGTLDDCKFSLDGTVILTASHNGMARGWDAQTGRLMFTTSTKHTARVNDVEPSPDGQRFLTISEDGTTRVWNLKTGEPIGPPLKDIMNVRSVQFCSDGRRLLTVSCDQGARVWDLATTDLSERPRPLIENERRLSSPDGRYFLEGALTRELRVIEGSTGAEVLKLPHPSEVTYAAFSRDGQWIVTACAEVNPVYSMRNDVFVWDTRTGTQKNVFPIAHRYQVDHVAFSPDQKLLMTCGVDEAARTWSFPSGQPVSAPMYHRQAVIYGSFSPDSKRVLTISSDKSVRVWDAYTGQPLTPPLQHVSAVASAQWMEDPNRLTTVTQDDFVQVWDLANAEPLTLAQRVRHSDFVRFDSISEPTSHSPATMSLDSRPVKDLVALAQTLAVGKIENGVVVPLEFDELSRLWTTQRSRYPDQFRVQPSEAIQWHLHQAQQAEANVSLDAAQFHLQQAIRLGAAERVVHDWRVRMDRRVERLRSGESPVFPLSEIPPRPTAASPQHIDLTRFYNLSLRDSLDQRFDDNTFEGLPTGLSQFRNQTFDVRGMVRLRSGFPDLRQPDFPAACRGIPVGLRCRKLHFLHSMALPITPHTTVGSYVLHYTDGATIDLPIVSGRDLDSYVESLPPSNAEKDHAQVVWKGTNPNAASLKLTLRLFHSERLNPRPGEVVSSLDFIASGSGSSPFLVAVTVE